MRSLHHIVSALPILTKVEEAANIGHMLRGDGDNDPGVLAEYHQVANHDLTTAVEFDPKGHIASKVEVVAVFNFGDGENSHASIAFRTVVGSNAWSILYRADPDQEGNQGVKDAATVAGQLKIRATDEPYEIGDDDAALPMIKRVAEFFFICAAFDRPTMPAASAG